MLRQRWRGQCICAGSDGEDDAVFAPNGSQETTVVAIHCGCEGVSIVAARCDLGVHFKVSEGDARHGAT
jgi:hypothetical protein